MKKYKAVSVTGIASGRVLLTTDQAKSRVHNLKPVDGEKDVYDVVNPIQFKSGEVFGHDGVPHKAQADELVEVGQSVSLGASAHAPKDKDAPAGKSLLDKAKNLVGGGKN